MGVASQGAHAGSKAAKMRKIRVAGTSHASWARMRTAGATLSLAALASLVVISQLAQMGIFDADDRRQMLDANAAAVAGARAGRINEDMHFSQETLSPLPRMARVSEYYGVKGHRHHHPQGDRYAPLPRSDERRGLQEGTGLLSEESTDQLKLHVDFSQMRQETHQRYGTCFEEGAWFRWNFPSSQTPPCAAPADVASRNTHQAWVESGQNPCPTADVDLYGPDNLEGQICNRNYMSEGQNCWGVCLKEDVLRVTPQDGCDGAAGRDSAVCEHLCDETKCVDAGHSWSVGDECTDECTCGDPIWCNMQAWAFKQINLATNETESYLRARKRTGNLVLQRSEGIFKHIYDESGIPAETACARDAELMFRLPVDPSYCTSGFDGDVIFYPGMAQFTPNIAGWGGNAGTDETGRPIILVMGWIIAHTPMGRFHQEQQGSARLTILHEIFHGLGFEKTNFRDRVDSNGASDPMVEQRTVPDDSDPVWFITSERTLAVAREYFGCPDLDGLPLMGDNQLGSESRGSHWETRIMNDEFLAYGSGDVVSSLTLAVFEDLGMYLGNHTATKCMYWGKKQGCEFVNSRCGVRQSGAEVTLAPGEGCNRHWASGTGHAWETSDGVPVADDLGGWNNSIQTHGSCARSSANVIVERYCAASLCRQQWPGMVEASADGVSAQQDTGIPLWACGHDYLYADYGVRYEYKQYVCDPNAGSDCTCSAECQTTDPSTGEFWGSAEGGGCTPTLGPVAAAVDRSSVSTDEENSLENLPLFMGLALLLMALILVYCVVNCLRQARFSCLVGASFSIFALFIIASFAALIMTVYAYIYFEDLDEIVSQNAWMMLIGTAFAVLCFAIYGTVSVCLVARQTGCCKECKCAIATFSLLLFALLVAQLLGMFVAAFWLRDSYSHSDGQYTTRGQMEGDMERTRTGISFIDTSIDKAIRDIEAVTCNSYKKCCYTIAQDSDTEADSPQSQERVAGRIYLPEEAPCDVFSGGNSQCNPGLADDVTGEVSPKLACTADIARESDNELVCGAKPDAEECLATTDVQYPAVQLCEWDGVTCNAMTIGTCRAAITDADTTFTCVSAHAGTAVGAAASALKDPSNPDFCQLLSGNNRKGIVPTGALCYAMEAVGVFEDLPTLRATEEGGSLATCAQDFCGSGVRGFEQYVSAIFGWTAAHVVPIAVMTAVLNLLEFLQLCFCLAMLFMDHDHLVAGYEKAKDTAKRRMTRVDKSEPASQDKGAP